jgi:hypothetical protein
MADRGVLPCGQVGDISGADFTESLMREDVQKRLCDRPDAKGTPLKPLPPRSKFPYRVIGMTRLTNLVWGDGLWEITCRAYWIVRAYS